MLNPIEKFMVTILHLNRDWYHWHGLWPGDVTGTMIKFFFPGMLVTDLITKFWWHVRPSLNENSRAMPCNTKSIFSTNHLISTMALFQYYLFDLRAFSCTCEINDDASLCVVVSNVEIKILRESVFIVIWSDNCFRSWNCTATRGTLWSI